MEPRFPSGSSALPVRRSKIRRRSGGLSPKLEDNFAASQNLVYSPSFRRTRHLQPVPDHAQDDPHRLRSEDDGLTILPPNSPDTHSLKDIGAPTVILVPPNEHESSQSISSRLFGLQIEEKANPRLESPLPPLPEEENWQINDQIAHDVPFTSIPLTPRPELPSSFHSQSSQSSKSSQRTIRSLIPRLPTPDFTRLKRIPLHQSIITPLNLFRAHVPSMGSTSASHSHQMDAGAAVLMGTAISSNSDLLVDISSRPESCRRYSLLTLTTASKSNWSNESSTLGDEELSSFFTATAPSRFTRKFPPPFSNTLLGRVYSKPGGLETLTASESGNDLGVEKIGRWNGYKWCLLLSVLTVSPLTKPPPGCLTSFII